MTNPSTEALPDPIREVRLGHGKWQVISGAIANDAHVVILRPFPEGEKGIVGKRERVKKGSKTATPQQGDIVIYVDDQAGADVLIKALKPHPATWIRYAIRIVDQEPAQ